MDRFDVAIIGTGPAGLEAALTLKNRNKKILLLGNNNSSDKVYKAHEIKNYLGLPNISGEDFSKAFIEHIKVMGIEITEDVISQIFWCAMTAVTYLDIIYWEKKSEEFFLNPKVVKYVILVNLLIENLL